MSEYNPKTIFDKTEDGDSQIYVGIKYLMIIAVQIDLIRQAQRKSLNEKGNNLFFWLNELRTFYDLIENRTNLFYSEKKVKIDSWKFEETTKKLEKIEIKVDEKYKYEKWFEEIEKMIERNSNVLPMSGMNVYQSAKYLNDKKILLEMSRCQRELLRDANSKHLIMPEGMKDMKALAKSEWIDRESKKDLAKDNFEEAGY